MKNIKILQIASIYIGIVFGAGFASGQELIAFFLGHGRAGAIGIAFAAGLLFLVGWAVMDICAREKISCYRDFMASVFGLRLGGILDIITGLFIFVIFSAMLAAAGALAEESFGIPFSLGAIALAGLSLWVLRFDAKGMIQINTALSPILVLGSLAISIYAIFSVSSQQVYADTLGAIVASWPMSAGIYASYNMLTAIAVLSALPTVVTDRKTAFAGAFAGGLTIAALGVTIALALLLNERLIVGFELPMLALSQSYGIFPQYAYSILLFLAIFTTAISNGYSTINWATSRTKLKSNTIKLAMVAIAIIFAHIGFSYIVRYVYRFFGYLGLFVSIAIVLHFILRRKSP